MFMLYTFGILIKLVRLKRVQVKSISWKYSNKFKKNEMYSVLFFKNKLSTGKKTVQKTLCNLFVYFTFWLFKVFRYIHKT